ncbi:rho GTPase-activating protein 7 [Dorcoceras hygrometricum]|uniref:Rho GTPase-activating protein 7 n=1 Tax=Dorcoceras hygrometricum TaxID=472368 RepID=A0A2Z7CIF5_9LAMI|nr:rho GTPase-activating protein 7 [Dorcoceras hygrometricum]
MSASVAAFERPRIGNLNTSALPQRGGEVNLTLGGIDLNNSGSVVVREDKKLLTVLFPDGRDGRAFTLKAETSEDLYDWKTALEHALAQAPSAALVMGHNGIFRSDANDTIEDCLYAPKSVWRIFICSNSFRMTFDSGRDKRPIKSLVVGRPILLALEDIDGGPSFLEKALRFLEQYGIKVEGILRQSADVEEVDRRVQEYEQGKTEFGENEDPHVVGDCVKHVLRELPSSPVPAACCTALLEAYKVDPKEARVNAMRSAVRETFPEPNRRLLQRILKMMHSISAHASENRMTPSAVAACMAPLLLRPLLAGECELEDDYDVNGDNSAQLLAAANAANNAQAIITTLLEEFDNIFDDDNLHRCSISADSQTDNSGSEDTSDDDNPDVKVNGYHDAENEVDPETDYDRDRRLSGKLSESSGSAASDLYDCKGIENDDSENGSPTHNHTSRSKPNQALDNKTLNDSSRTVNEPLEEQKKACENMMDASLEIIGNESQRSMGEILSSMDSELHQSIPAPELLDEKTTPRLTTLNFNTKKSNFWGRKNARKTPSTESIDSSGEEELAIQRLEIAKNDLRQRIAKEARGNAILQASLERRKQALHERRLALEQDVGKTARQHKLREIYELHLEVGLSISSGQFSGARSMDSKTRAELEEIALAEADVARLKQKVAELHHQLNQQRQHHYGALSDTSDRYQRATNTSSQQKYFPQDFDSTLAVCNHERKQRTEEFLATDLRNIKGQILTSGSSSRQPSRKQFMESTSLSDSKSTEASTSLSMDDLCAVDSASLPSTSRAAEALDYSRHPPAASSTLVELTTRLDFFKERRSQLMEQLHNLDLNYGSLPQDFVYKPSSPRWN